jgi:uncharacterized RDD family membrane protein YckC
MDLFRNAELTQNSPNIRLQYCLPSADRLADIRKGTLMAYQGTPPYQGGPPGGQPPYGGPPGGPPGGQPPYGGGQPPYGGGQPPYGGGQPPYGGPGGPPPYQGPQGQYGSVPTYQYSDWIHRVGAYLVDVAPIIVLEVIVLPFNNFGLRSLLWIVALGYTIWNRWVMGGQGQSLGKRVVGMRLVSEQTGQPIGTLNAFLRDICHFVDAIICYVGFLFPLWDAKRQTIADKIMRTVVVPA